MTLLLAALLALTHATHINNEQIRSFYILRGEPPSFFEAMINLVDPETGLLMALGIWVIIINNILDIMELMYSGVEDAPMGGLVHAEEQ
ncbi:hypothetical protein PSACC_01254 [Paramicrosporidium saccamoebae]|uniref:Uncharacterized protein n=1 Tax=Paramicrosporidium saccamoebae TaxID=1246581 RepID=A0A2H9TMF2_9FUNG|nr:hypothetical protein PSACC_01254 [Paramicrosporidium saccamoebae]